MNETNDLTAMIANIVESVERLRKVYTANTYGPQDVGYLWQGVFLANGTMLTLRDQQVEAFCAVVKHGDLMLDGVPISFQGLCDSIENKQSTDAMTELRVLRPDDWEWIGLADLKKQKKTGRIHRFDKPHYKL